MATERQKQRTLWDLVAPSETWATDVIDAHNGRYDEDSKRRPFTRKATRPLQDRTNEPEQREASQNDGRKRLRQAFLDFGQRDIGPSVCSTCGMVYNRGVEEDESAHSMHHFKSLRQSFLGHLNTRAGKQAERVVWHGQSSRVIALHPGDGKRAIRRAIALAQRMEGLLGSEEGHLSRKVRNQASPPRWCFLAHVCSGGQIGGALLAEKIDRAYRMSSGSNGNALVVDTSLPVKASVGIAAMWVDPNCRRQGIATNLFHLARKYTVSGYWAPAQEVAFSQPSEMGRLFMASVGGEEELIYLAGEGQE